MSIDLSIETLKANGTAIKWTADSMTVVPGLNDRPTVLTYGTDGSEPSFGTVIEFFVGNLSGIHKRIFKGFITGIENVRDADHHVHRTITCTDKSWLLTDTLDGDYIGTDASIFAALATAAGFSSDVSGLPGDSMTISFSNDSYAAAFTKVATQVNCSWWYDSDVDKIFASSGATADPPDDLDVDNPTAMTITVRKSVSQCITRCTGEATGSNLAYDTPAGTTPFLPVQDTALYNSGGGKVKCENDIGTYTTKDQVGASIGGIVPTVTQEADGNLDPAGTVAFGYTLVTDRGESGIVGTGSVSMTGGNKGLKFEYLGAGGTPTYVVNGFSLIQGWRIYAAQGSSDLRQIGELSLYADNSIIITDIGNGVAPPADDGTLVQYLEMSTPLAVAHSAGDAINVYVVRNDAAGQSALAADFPGSTGIITANLQQGNLDEAGITALCDAELAARPYSSNGQLSVEFDCYDLRNIPGTVLHGDYAAVGLPSSDLVISDVTYDVIKTTPAKGPKVTVTATPEQGNRPITVESIIKQVVKPTSLPALGNKPRTTVVKPTQSTVPPIRPPVPPTPPSEVWTFTDQTATFFGYNVHDVCWSPTLAKFCVVGSNQSTGHFAAATSADGVTWTLIDTGLNGDGIAVVWADALGIFIAADQSGFSWTSSTGASWTPHALPGGSPTPVSLAWNDGGSLAVILGNLTGDVLTSSDGMAWTNHSAAMPSKTWADVTFANGIFVAVNQNTGGSVIVTSPDGVTWTSHALPLDVVFAGPTSSERCIAWNSSLGLFAAVGYDGVSTGIIVTSPDGATWTQQTLPVTDTLVGVVSGSDGFYVGDNDVLDQLLFSADGITWVVDTLNGVSTGGWEWATGTFSPSLGNVLFFAPFSGAGPILYGHHS